MKRRKAAIDPITIEIISNGLRSIADETFVALMKSAYSTNIKERRDHSTAICDCNGRLISQAEASLADPHCVDDWADAASAGEIC